MNGCLHCMLFRPAWNEAVEMCKTQAGVNVAECEYADMKRLPTSMQKVMGFPTIMVYQNAKPVAEYQSSRTAEDVADFMKAHAAPQKAVKKPVVRKPSKPIAKPIAKPPTKKAKPSKTKA